ncbi:MAG: protein kinase [Verrucomicrobiaceae bacterium]|nr:protein kinase [Verrucomicrobiaceae bacterium]
MSSPLPRAQPSHPGASGGELRDILPNYEVLDLIGRGGMGVVYKARQVSLDRIVAIKLLPREIIRDDIDFQQRFKLEAQTMAKLSHPGIVAVHDFGETEDGQLFFVMEFIDGQDLAKRIEQGGALPVEEAVGIFRCVAEALMYAHSQGVIHRDIKPANILIKANGEVKVADFGLAKIVAPGTVGLTATSTSMGSHDFAAPEIFVHGGDADHRADIFSLGVMLYQMLTGTIPRGMFKLPSERVPALGTRFDEIVCKAMEQDREDRYDSVVAMLDAVVRVSLPQSNPDVLEGEPSLLQRIRMTRWAAVAAALLIVSPLSWFHFQRSSHPTEPAITSSEWQDGLAQIDVTKHRRAGRWKFVDGKLANGDDASGSCIELPIAAPGASDLRIKMTRLTPGSGAVTLGFHIGVRGGQFIISDYSRPCAGLEYIDGKSITTNGLQVEHSVAYLTIGHPHELLLSLREDGMIALLDGVEIYRWKGDWSRVTQGGGWLPEAMLGRNVFAIASRLGRIEVDEISFRHVVGAEAKTLPAGMPQTPPLPAAQIFAGNGHRYQFVPGAFIWTEAEANAKSMGGHLATLTSQEENDWVWQTFSPWLPSQLTNSRSARGWWIGGLQDTPEKPWRWVTGEPFEFSRFGTAKAAPSRGPRLAQHDNGGGAGLSSWSTFHYSIKKGYLVEWDQIPATEDSDARKLVAWALSLPLSTEPSHEEHKVPDVMIEGSQRNLRKVSELPTTPFALSRIRIGPLMMDETARQHLDILARQTRLYDLRIYAAEDAAVLTSVRPLTRLGTFVFKAMPDKARALTDEQLASLADLVNLNSLRIEGWSGMTGSGFAAFKNKRKLSSVTLNDCPDLNDAGLAEIAKFTGLESLSLLGAIKLTDVGLLQLKSLKQLRSLGLGTRTRVSPQALDELKLALPQCAINTSGS